MVVQADLRYVGSSTVATSRRDIGAVEHTLTRLAGRAKTDALHHEAVERVVVAMRERLDQPLTLRDLADIAAFSPFHFDRLFRRLTGLPPGRFLTMVRMEAARRLLLTTQHSVTDVCLDVGYSSIGSFTYQFTELLGLSPSRLRRLAMRNGRCLDRHPDMLVEHSPPVPFGHGLSGWIDATDEAPGPIFVGLFQAPRPEGRPVACTILAEPGPFRIGSLPDGRYYAFAVSLPRSTDDASMLMPDMTTVQVAASADPIDVEGGRAQGRADLTLRSSRLIDPPLLVTLPLLLAEAEAASSSRTCESDTREPVQLHPTEQSQRRQIAARLR
jgi:AraC-like DNA-binding protein